MCARCLHLCIQIRRINFPCNIWNAVLKWSIRQCIHFGGQFIMETLQHCYEAMLTQGSKIPTRTGKASFLSLFLTQKFSNYRNCVLPDSTWPWNSYRSSGIERHFAAIHLRRLIKAYLVGSFQIYCIWEYIMRQQCQILISEISKCMYSALKIWNTI